jgi:hypothetical protein
LNLTRFPFPLTRPFGPSPSTGNHRSLADISRGTRQISGWKAGVPDDPDDSDLSDLSYLFDLSDLPRIRFPIFRQNLRLIPRNICPHPNLLYSRLSTVNWQLMIVRSHAGYNLFSSCIVTHDRALIRVFSARLIHTRGAFGEHHHHHTPSLPEGRIRESINTCFRQIISVPGILIVIKPLTAAGLRAAGGRARGTSPF